MTIKEFTELRKKHHIASSELDDVIDFVTELFKQAQAKGIHTALDTSGLLFNRNNTEKIDELLNGRI